MKSFLEEKVSVFFYLGFLRSGIVDVKKGEKMKKKILKIVLLILTMAMVFSAGYVVSSLSKGSEILLDERGIQDVRVEMKKMSDGKVVTVEIDYMDGAYCTVEYLHNREEYDGSMGTYCILIRMSDVFGHVSADAASAEIEKLNSFSDIKVGSGARWLDAESYGICIGSDKPLTVDEKSYNLPTFGTVGIAIMIGE